MSWGNGLQGWGNISSPALGQAAARRFAGNFLVRWPGRGDNTPLERRRGCYSDERI